MYFSLKRPLWKRRMLIFPFDRSIKPQKALSLILMKPSFYKESLIRWLQLINHMISAAWMSADPKLVEHAIREEEKKAKEMEKKLEGYLVETGVRRQYFMFYLSLVIQIQVQF